MLIGFLAETFKSYDPVFYLCAGALMLSFLVGLIVHLLQHRKHGVPIPVDENSALKPHK